LLACLRSIPRANRPACPANPALDAPVRQAEARLAETGATLRRALAA
jgi:hypothetical protein